MDEMLEQLLLHHLQFAPLTRAELVRRTGATDHTVQSALDELVKGTFVVRRPQQGMPAEYELTVTGTARLKIISELVSSPSTAIRKAIKGVISGALVEAADSQPLADSRPPERRRATVVRQPAARPSMVRNRLLLSDADRSVCSDALAEQFGLGRIDKAELDRRTDLLYAARTRGQLKEVFDGLPAPVLDRPAKRTYGIPPWRMRVFKGASILSGPFLLMGLALVVAHPDVYAVLYGALLIFGVWVWNYLAWYWASKGRARR